MSSVGVYIGLYKPLFSNYISPDWVSYPILAYSYGWLTSLLNWIIYNNELYKEVVGKRTNVY